MNRFTRDFDNILNNATCEKAMRYTKSFDFFIDKDEAFTKGKIGFYTDDYEIKVKGVGKEKIIVSSIPYYLKEKIAFTVDYSRKFMILALLNHLDKDRFDLASTYINRLLRCRNSKIVFSLIMQMYEWIIRVRKELIPHAKEIARMIDNTKESTNMMKIFFEKCFNENNLSLFVSLHCELEKFPSIINSRKMKVDTLKHCIENRRRKIQEEDSKIFTFLRRLFEIYGPNMINSSVFHTREKKISDLLLEEAINCANFPTNQSKLNAMKRTIDLPGIAQFYRERADKPLNSKLCSLMLDKYIGDEVRLQMAQLFLTHNLVDPNCFVQVSEFDLRARGVTQFGWLTQEIVNNNIMEE